MSDNSNPTGVYIKLVLVALLWGGAFVAGRIVSAELNALTAALWRYVVATAALLALAFAIERGLPRLTMKQWLGVFVLGALSVAVTNLCFMYGLQTVSAARASLIFALIPAATLLGGRWFLHEPLTGARILGIAIALLGVAVELGGGNPFALFAGGVGSGEVALFGCVLAWSAYTLLSKRLLGEGVSSIAATTFAALAGTILLAAACAATGDLVFPHASLRVWLAIAFLGLFSTALAYVWYFDGVSVLGPARTAVFINLVPVVAIGLGVLILNEKLELSMVIGAALVVSGVFIINRAPVAVAVRHAPAHPV
jgi:drug/metabolite transporter (DMT)-like permease